MKRVRRVGPVAPALVSPGEETAELALRHAAGLMAPVARWLLRSGVSYGALAHMLKPVFVEAAREELARTGTEPTYSALSVLSGVHRKDVRGITASERQAPAVARPSLAAQVFTRWSADRRLRDGNGAPRPLPRVGKERSFETLCRELSQDVHPRAVLDELLRLGLVALDGENVVVTATAFVPTPRLADMSALFAANAADHIAAAVSNLTLDAPKFLEQSIYADGLSQASIELLHAAARKAWAAAFDEVVGEARERLEQDRGGSDTDHRMRFGVYFFSEPAPAPAPAAPAARKRAGNTPLRQPGKRRTRIEP